MTRDGTVGRSDATEGSLTLRWDVDPVRVMRPRFADSIRASSRFGLHQQAGLDCKRRMCGTPNYLLPGGGHPHMSTRREFLLLAAVVMSIFAFGGATGISQSAAQEAATNVRIY